ncbi:MAG: putative sensor protein [Frankiales bacterium]|nr:putative sensor protein [Frankiales bacterium]
MAQQVRAADVRRASGLPDVALLRVPARAARVQALADRMAVSTLLPGLVRLAARTAGTDDAQLSLLSDAQTSLSVRCSAGGCATRQGSLEESLCTVTVLSGDVLVAADARSHPWLSDLPPVTTGAVGCYLGVPLRLADGTTVGALCAFSPTPREWTQAQVSLTCDVADVVALELQRLAQD